MYVVSLGLAAGRKICKKASGRGGGHSDRWDPLPQRRNSRCLLMEHGFSFISFRKRKKRKKKSHFLFYCIDHTNQIDRISSTWWCVDILMATNKRIRFFESFSTALPKFRKKKQHKTSRVPYGHVNASTSVSFVVVVIEWRLWFIRHMALRPYDNNNPSCCRQHTLDSEKTKFSFSQLYCFFITDSTIF